MSEKFYKTFEEFINSIRGLPEDRKECVKIGWLECLKAHKEEIESLKSKFFEATKTYTNEIDELQEENAALKEQIDEYKNKNKLLQDALDCLTEEDPFYFTTYCSWMRYEYEQQIKRMRSWKNCAHEVDSDGCDKAGNLDGSCPCDKWEMMK